MTVEGLKLLPMAVDELHVLDKTEYRHLSPKERLALVLESDQGLHGKEFFKLYVVRYQETPVVHMPSKPAI